MFLQKSLEHTPKNHLEKHLYHPLVRNSMQNTLYVLQYAKKAPLGLKQHPTVKKSSL